MSSRCLTSVFMRTPIFTGLLDGVPLKKKHARKLGYLRLIYCLRKQKWGMDMSPMSSFLTQTEP